MPQKKNNNRQQWIVGNWKMYKTIAEAQLFVETVAPQVPKSQAKVAIAVPYTTISPLAEVVHKKGYSLQIGAQNMHQEKEGAFTGEISLRMLQEAGAQFVILGHSERRRLFHENDALINKKIHRAVSEKFPVIFCIGELLEEREKGETFEVFQREILEGLKGIENLNNIILAYEPVWAIGTGKVAHPDDAENSHKMCRDIIAKQWGKLAAENISILYGGSVNHENCSSLMSKENIDGLLIGGASLSPATFNQIINECL